MFRQKIVFFLWMAGVFCNHLYAQEEIKFSAATYFKYKDYNRALNKYLQQYENDKNNIDVNYHIGICYLNINNDKSKAIPFLESVYKNGKYENDLLLNLGLAYTYSFQFDQAINYFNKYKQITKNFLKKRITDNYIVKCENAKLLMQNPVNVTFHNLGYAINTEFPEFFPFVTENQNSLFFTSSREKNISKKESSLGYYTSDIYYSTFENNKWTKAASIGNTVNTIEDEQCVYVSPNGKNMIISVDNQTSFGDLFLTTSEKKGRFSRPTRFDKPVNSKYFELEGSINKNQNTMFISRKRRSFGTSDIYMVKKLKNNEWGKPLRLGPEINTKYKEAFPVYDEKNSTLYFSSEGHFNMGGFDIFKSKFDSTSQTFGKVINLGYPINTPEDNMQISLAGNDRDAYISAFRKEGFGDLDIYKITFNDIEIKQDSVEINRDSIADVNIKDTINSDLISTDRLVYRIQIGEDQDTISKNSFKGLTEIYTESFPGGTKYFTGEYNNYKMAQEALDHIITKGIPDAFIVAYFNKARISIEEAQGFENKNKYPQK